MDQQKTGRVNSSQRYNHDNFKTMHYQQKMDKLFSKGGIWKHRTLRTLFDPFSSEYDDTTMEKKAEILKMIIDNNLDLNELILEYKEFYTEENKLHVVDVADEGLRRLMAKLSS